MSERLGGEPSDLLGESGVPVSVSCPESAVIVDAVPAGGSAAGSSVSRVAPLREDGEVLPLPTVEGGFRTVLADPPWRFRNRTGKVAPEHRRLDRYSTMTLEDIKGIPVDGVTAKDAHCYLWVPNALLPEGLEVMRAWGSGTCRILCGRRGVRMVVRMVVGWASTSGTSLN